MRLQRTQNQSETPQILSRMQGQSPITCRLHHRKTWSESSPLSRRMLVRKVARCRPRGGEMDDVESSFSVLKNMSSQSYDLSFFPTSYAMTKSIPIPSASCTYSTPSKRHLLLLLNTYGCRIVFSPFFQP